MLSIFNSVLLSEVSTTIENTGKQDLAPVTPKQKKKPKFPPESDKNQKDIRSYIAASPPQAMKKP